MSYPGGKNGDGVYQTIINRMPPHEVYIEPFLGGGAIMRLKKPARLNIGLDLDPAPVAGFGDGAGGIAGTGAAVLRAGNGDARSRRSPGKLPSDVRTVENGAAGPEFRIFPGDALGFLRSYSFLGSELVYCDPPYMRETRTRDCYRCELSDRDHAELLRILKLLPCMVMVSGYFTRLYDVELRDWHAVHFPAVTRGGTERTEWLWMNFPEPMALHDYRYLGADFRERERIKRKKRRWVERIERMPLLERRALLSAIQEATSTSAGNGDPARRSPSLKRTMRDPVAISGDAAAG